MRAYLGIDLSLNNSGYVVLENGSDKTVAVGKIQPKELRETERLGFIFKEFGRLFRTRKFTAIGLEGYSFGSRGSRAFSIGEAGGIVKLMLHSTKIPFYVIQPTAVKKFATGKGNTQKSHMLKTVFKLWDFDTEDEDIADAYAIAQLTRAIYSKKNRLKLNYIRGFQKEVIEKIMLKDLEP